MPNEKCSASVWAGQLQATRQCSNGGKLEHDGQVYCEKHYPPHIELEQKEKEHKYKKRQAYGKKKRAIEAHEAEASDIVKRIARKEFSNPFEICENFMQELKEIEEADYYD